MRISDIAHRGVVGIQATAPVLDAARLMTANQVGSLLVFSGHALAGILSEGDVVRAAAEADDLGQAMVGEYMTPDPLVVAPDEDSAEVAVRMIELGVRHLPVVEFGEPVGMISARDLLALEAWPPARA